MFNSMHPDWVDFAAERVIEERVQVQLLSKEKSGLEPFEIHMLLFDSILNIVKGRKFHVRIINKGIFVEYHEAGELTLILVRSGNLYQSVVKSECECLLIVVVDHSSGHCELFVRKGQEDDDVRIDGGNPKNVVRNSLRWVRSGTDIYVTGFTPLCFNVRSPVFRFLKNVFVYYCRIPTIVKTSIMGLKLRYKDHVIRADVTGNCNVLLSGKPDAFCYYAAGAAGGENGRRSFFFHCEDNLGTAFGLLAQSISFPDGKRLHFDETGGVSRHSLSMNSFVSMQMSTYILVSWSRSTSNLFGLLTAVVEEIKRSLKTQAGVDLYFYCKSGRDRSPRVLLIVMLMLGFDCEWLMELRYRLAGIPRRQFNERALYTELFNLIADYSSDGR